MTVVRLLLVNHFTLLLLLTILGMLSSCNPTELTARNSRGYVNYGDGSMEGKAFVYKDSPYIFAGAKYGPNNVDMGEFLDPVPELITENSNLTGNCVLNLFYEVSIDECFRSFVSEASSSQSLPRNEDGTFIFPANSPEFYQVNAQYHLRIGTEKFFEKLSFAWNQVQFEMYKSIPGQLATSKLFWFKAMSSLDRKIFNFDYLTMYSQCDLDGNAAFSVAEPSLCFGGLKDHSNFYFVQDPSVIYHELGHALISIMMNMRNYNSTYGYHPLRSNLGSLGYNEAGSIGEGVADYFSYIMNKRERFGEYALGIFEQSRPLSEADTLHTLPGIEETSEGRLSYPQYLLYDPNNKEEPYEDVHYAGQIVSHYLVALTKSLKTECYFTNESDGGHEMATNLVFLLLSETFSELGDLFAKGVDTTSSYNFTNLDKDSSYLWTQTNNPITFRRFFQTFAKKIHQKVSTINACSSFDKNKSEKLLDDYGLLLFKTLNDNGTSTIDASVGYSPILTSVSENNRRKSVLVSKDLLALGSRTEEYPSRVSFYIIDNSTDIENLLKELLYKGFTVPISSGTAGTEYNNDNAKISPGEIIGIIPDLLNNSNSTIAGVQLLATDWDHVDITDQQTGNFKPCVIDSTTTVDQGGETGNTCTTTSTTYKRLIKDSFTGLFPNEAAAPACMVLSEEGESSRWVSQNEFRKKQGLSLLDKDCLGYQTGVMSDTDFTYNPHECLIRFLPGKNEAYYSRIEPQKTYHESVVGISGNRSFNVGNLLLMEVNKWIPPGTKFRCRLRARFSNCSDCYTDGTNSNDDFIDAEFNGMKPYKILNFDFEIND